VTTRPSVAILLDAERQRALLDGPTVSLLERSFALRWPENADVVSAKEAAKLLETADGCMTGWGTPRLSADVLEGARKLKIMAHAAGTVKTVASDTLWRRGILVTSAAAALAVDVAHFTLALMVVGRKNFMELSARAGGGEWGRESGGLPPDELRGCTVGVIAASHIGRNVISLLKHFNVEILLYDPHVSEKLARDLGAEWAELDEVFKRSDIVSIHAPALPTTRHMVNAERLAHMREGATLINTSRGSLVDEAALVAELQKRRIWAFLDVTDPEPPPAGSILYGCPNLTLTPHLAGSLGRGRRWLGRLAAEELTRFFAGEKPLHPVSREMLDRIA
jgi:phosphoglycerate dehydrogenase-like enzyme